MPSTDKNEKYPSKTNVHIMHTHNKNKAKLLLADPTQSIRSPGILVIPKTQKEKKEKKTQQNNMCFTLFLKIDSQFNHLYLQSWSILSFNIFFKNST